MCEYPAEVEQFHAAIKRLRGVTDVWTGIKDLGEFPPDTYSLPGEFGDLPHALLRRTDGGLPDEAWSNTEIQFSRDVHGWLALEFLAWWVRDCSRGGIQIQMRVQALPPKGFQNQLGRTLKFIIDSFEICPDDPGPMLVRMADAAESLNDSIEIYSDVLGESAK